MLNPTRSTFSCSIVLIISSGVNLIPWYITSIPASLALTAICSAPLECPSSPGFPIKILIGLPNDLEIFETSFLTSLISSSLILVEIEVPVGGLYSPNNSLNELAHSPVVTPFTTHSIVAPIMFSDASTDFFKLLKDSFTFFWSLFFLYLIKESIFFLTKFSSTFCIDSFAPIGDSSVSVNALTPIIFLLPFSISWDLLDNELTSASFMYPFSRATAAPPISSIFSISLYASFFKFSTFSFITVDPLKISPYSNKSVSNASICWNLNDHCWSQGLGKPNASFQPGNWTALALASLLKVTASISMIILATLFSGCWAVSPRELTWTPYLNLLNLGFFTPYLFVQISSHISVNALILHNSSINFIPAFTKNDILPTTFSNSSGGIFPDSLTVSNIQIAFESAKANSWTGVAPASCKW